MRERRNTKEKEGVRKVKEISYLLEGIFNSIFEDENERVVGTRRIKVPTRSCECVRAKAEN